MTNAELEQLCRDRKTAAEIRDQADAEVKKITAVIGDELHERGVVRVALDSFTPQWVTQTRHTLDKVKLVEAGVPMETIESATIERTTTFVRVEERRAGKAQSQSHSQPEVSKAKAV